MSKPRAPFTSIKVLPSGRFRAQYRPRQARAYAKTFDTREEALGYLSILKKRLEEQGEVSRITGRRECQMQAVRDDG